MRVRQHGAAQVNRPVHIKDDPANVSETQQETRTPIKTLSRFESRSSRERANKKRAGLHQPRPCDVQTTYDRTRRKQPTIKPTDASNSMLAGSGTGAVFSAPGVGVMNVQFVVSRRLPVPFGSRPIESAAPAAAVPSRPNSSTIGPATSSVDCSVAPSVSAPVL